jgi:hypothetical protein
VEIDDAGRYVRLTEDDVADSLKQKVQIRLGRRGQPQGRQCGFHVYSRTAAAASGVVVEELPGWVPAGDPNTIIYTLVKVGRFEHLETERNKFEDRAGHQIRTRYRSGM